MILTIGRPDYSYRSTGEIKGASIKGQRPGRDLNLLLMSFDGMEDLHEKLPNVRGFPRYVAFDTKKQRLWLHPAPDGEYELMVDVVPEKSTSTLTLPKKGQA